MCTHTHKASMADLCGKKKIKDHPVLELSWVNFMAANIDITYIHKTATKKLIYSKQNYYRFAPQNRFVLMCHRDFRKSFWNKDLGT